MLACRLGDLIVMAAYADNDRVPVSVSAISAKLSTYVSESGVACLKPILENFGILTYDGLGQLSEEEIEETCKRVRAAGFGPGHTRSLRALGSSARSEIALHNSRPPDSSDAPLVLSSPLSPKLHFKLTRKGLQLLEPIFAQSGVRSAQCFGTLSDSERLSLEAAVQAAGFDTMQVLAMRELQVEVAVELRLPPSLHKIPSPLRDISRMPSHDFKDKENASENDINSVGQSQGLKRVQMDEQSSDDGSSAPLEKRLRSATVTVTNPNGCLAMLGDTVERQSNASILPRLEDLDDEVVCSQDVSDVFEQQPRLSGQAIDDLVINLRAVQAQPVKYRDRESGKLLTARVPVAVITLLRLRAACIGKEEGDQKLARMAMDVMEEHAFDPVRAVASLSPASMLCPATAMRVLGGGCIGAVFLEELTGTAVKVIIEDNAPEEYKVFCAFADAGIAPRPIALDGPRVVPSGNLYCIRMEAVTHTLQGVMADTALRGPRRGLSPPNDEVARRLGTAVVTALSQMWDRGLVHGDLHLENIGLTDPDAQPTVQIINFGRSCSSAGLQEGQSRDAFRAGHEYDVFRFITELCTSFDKLETDAASTKKEREKDLRECKAVEKEMREAKRGKEVGCVHVMHQSRQVAGLQAFLTDEPRALEQAECAYNIVLGAVLRYAGAKFNFNDFAGSPSVKNRKMRQAAGKRQKAGYTTYFASTLYWGW